MLRGLTQREITTALPMGDQPIVNPDTGETYDLSTVNRDTKVIHQMWKDQSVAAIADLKARHFAEVSEVRSAALGKSRT